MFIQPTTLFAATFLCLIAPQAEVLEFTPKADSTLVRTVTVRKVTEIESATISFLDHEIETGSDVVMSGTRTLRIVDVLGKVEGDRVLDFVRTYEEIVDESTVEGGDGDVEIHAPEGEPSVLEGQQVAFTWDADDEEYTRKYAGEEEGEDGWLTELGASLDLVDWLPEVELEVGGQWELSIDALSSLIWYGGRLYPIQFEEHDGGPEGSVAINVPNLSDTHVLSGGDGNIELTLERVDEEDGARIAVVTFVWTGSIEQDLTDEASALSEAKGEGTTYDAAEQTMEMSGAGELSWDLKAGRLVALSLDLKQEIEENAEWTASGQGLDLEFSCTTQKANAYHIELTFELAAEEE